MEEIVMILSVLLGASFGFIAGVVWMIKNHPFAVLAAQAESTKDVLQQAELEWCEGCPLSRRFGENFGCLAKGDCIKENYPKTNYEPAIPERRR